MADGQVIYQGLLERGFTPPQAAALAGNIQQESSFNPNAYNKGSDAQGLMQWRLDRKTGLSDYAKATGRDPSDPEAQLDYIVHEMTGPEAQNASGFLAANDVQTANEALKKYIRYGSNEGGKRLDYAMAFAPQGGAAPQSGAQPGFVNPGFSGGMPAVPSFGASGAPTAPAPPGSTQEPPAPAGAPPASISDDALLKAFLPGGSPTANSPATSANSSDDEFLKQFLPSAADQAKAAEANPLAGTQQLFPGADALSALFTSGVDAIPVVGHPLMQGLEGLKARINGQDQQQVAAVDQAVQGQQPVASTAGRVIGTVAPLLAAPELIPGAGTALGMSGNLLTRMSMGALTSAGLEGADTLTRGGSLADAGKNALLAGAFGAGAAPVADVIGTGINRLLSGTSPDVARLAQLARDKYNIPVGPGQMSDNGMVRFADSVVNKMPMSGGTASSAAQQGAFNRAVANTFGATADKITPDVMASAKTRLGNVFDSVADRTPAIPYDPTIEDSLIKTIDDANQVLTPSEIAPLKNQVDAIVGKFGQGNSAISGDVYQALTRKGTPLDRLLSSDNPNIQFYAGQIRNALDDALERAAPADALADLQKARAQYKAMKTIEPLVAKAPTGDVSPALLMGRVNSSYGDTAYGGGGDLAELARIGQQFLKAPPSSGTAERLAIMELGKKALGPAGVAGVVGTAALNPGALPMTLATGIPALAAYAATAKGAGALLRSDAVANKLIQNSLGQTAPMTGGVANRLLRSAVPTITPRQPVQIMVRPGADAAGNRLLAQ